MVVPLREGGLAGIWSSVQWVRHSLSSQSIIYHLQLWKRSSWTPGMACQWVHHFSAVQSCCSTGSIIITIIIWDRETGTCKVSTATFSCRVLPKLLVAFFVAMLVVFKNGTAHGTYHGETWCRLCACGKTTSCAELPCHSKHPRWRGFPHCYSQWLPLRETPIKRVMGLQCKGQHFPP